MGIRSATTFEEQAREDVQFPLTGKHLFFANFGLSKEPAPPDSCYNPQSLVAEYDFPTEPGCTVQNWTRYDCEIDVDTLQVSLCYFAVSNLSSVP